MHWTRYLLRGFDHTGLLAKKLSHRLHLPFFPCLKTAFRRRQTSLIREKRIANKKNSFSVKKGYTVPSHIILIDDVVSSGATLNEAARVLKSHGAQVVICFLLASNA